MTPSSALESRFRDVLKSQGVPRGAVCLIGFSGGGDSAALLGLAADAGDWMFHAARVTHGLRGFTEEEAERGLCRDLCHRLHIQYTDLVLPPGKIAAMEGRLGCGTEQAARQARSTLLEQHRQNIGADFILLGHTADDQLETILMRLLTGSGPEGLKGIPMRRGKILRPLLGETRAHLRCWLREKDMQWAEDSMNASSKYRRSRIRNELVPLISSIIPGWEKAALTLAERSMEVQIALDSVFRRCIQAEWTNREGRWTAGEWDSAPEYMKAMALWAALNHFDDSQIPDRRFPWSTIADARRSLDTSGKWTGFGVSIRRSDGYFVAKRCPGGTGQARIVVGRDDIAGQFSEALGPWDIRIGFSHVGESRGYPVCAGDWPLILTVNEEEGRVNISLFGRGRRITNTLSPGLCDDDESEMVYIQVSENKEG